MTKELLEGVVSVREIAKDVFLLESAKGSYVYLVLGQEPVLIDTGMRGRDKSILRELAEKGISAKDIAHIFLTHHDVDHIGNAKSLTEASGAKLWAPKLDLPYIHGERKREGFRRVISSLVRAETPLVEHAYEIGDRIGGIEVIPTPGHTPGHVSFLYRDILFAGDLVTTRKGKLKPAPGFLTWDKGALRKSLHVVGQRPFDWVCPAHGEPVKRGNLWDALMGH